MVHLSFVLMVWRQDSGLLTPPLFLCFWGECSAWLLSILFHSFWPTSLSWTGGSIHPLIIVGRRNGRESACFPDIIVATSSLAVFSRASCIAIPDSLGCGLRTTLFPLSFQ